MKIRAMLHAVILTLYNVVLIKLYLDAFLECKKWKQSIIGWGLFIVWEMGRIIQVLHVGSPGILTHQSPGWNLLTHIIVMGAVGLFSNCCAEGRSGNLALDALINHLTQETMKYKIELDLNIDVNGEMNLDDTELCVLVGNVFDNAVEASKKIAENRKIWVHFSYKKGYLCFLVKNRYNGRIQRDGKIIKSTKEGMHGFGLLSVKRIVNNYHGNMEISEKDKIFSVKITAFC